MSDHEDPDTAVLRGQRRYLEGWHELIVKDQKLLLAEGLMLVIFRPQSDGARWYGESTGKDGEPVCEGERVKVFNAIVEFRN